MNLKQLANKIETTHIYFKGKATAAINVALTVRNWIIGYQIVEFEQSGEDRAKYGDNLINELADSLNVNGISSTNLKLARQFYLTYPQIGQTVSDVLNTSAIGQTLSDQSNVIPKDIKGLILIDDSNEELSISINIRAVTKAASGDKNKHYGVDAHKIVTQLNFSHIVELLKIEDPVKRAFYEGETIRNIWSVRELRKQISRQLFERTGLSSDKEQAIQLANRDATQLKPEQFLRSPMTLEFLNHNPQEVLEESKLETALLSNLTSFLTELGTGFCFEARQKMILIGDEYFFVDLVFYHRILHCHVLIDLKVDEFKHEYAGQLNAYVNYYKENVRVKGDRLPFGMLLCTGQNKPLVDYALGGIRNKIFVTDYKLQIPAEKELILLIEKHKNEF